jgi:hypothetical protein
MCTGNVDWCEVTLVLPDNLIQKGWLQVTMKANEEAGLAAPDVFYFGNATGHAGNSFGNALVGAADEIAARNDSHTVLNPATIVNLHDYNREGLVNSAAQADQRAGLACRCACFRAGWRSLSVGFYDQAAFNGRIRNPNAKYAR